MQKNPSVHRLDEIIHSYLANVASLRQRLQTVQEKQQLATRSLLALRQRLHNLRQSLTPQSAGKAARKLPAGA